MGYFEDCNLSLTQRLREIAIYGWALLMNRRQLHGGWLPPRSDPKHALLTHWAPASGFNTKTHLCPQVSPLDTQLHFSYTRPTKKHVFISNYKTVNRPSLEAISNFSILA